MRFLLPMGGLDPSDPRYGTFIHNWAPGPGPDVLWSQAVTYHHPPCRCGHPWDLHQHLRVGQDCGICDCDRFRTPRRYWWQRFKAKQRRRLGL